MNKRYIKDELMLIKRRLEHTLEEAGEEELNKAINNAIVKMEDLIEYIESEY